MATVNIYTRITSNAKEWEGQLAANGLDLGSIKLGEVVAFEVPNGEVVLTAKGHKAKSNQLTLSNLQAGETVDIDCEVVETIYSNAASVGSSQAGCLGAIIIFLIAAVLDAIMPRRIKLSRKN